jgi:tetratricopeptide (TPR) repeat protein
MVASDDIFQLIKSLSPSEKRYFKVFASKHVIGAKNNYEKLFDAYEALPDDQPYNEDAFKKSLKGKSYGKNLAQEKKYLTDLVMQSMRAYHAEKDYDGQLYDTIADIRFYFSKGLIAISAKAVEKGIEMASEQENLTALLTLLDYRLRISRLASSSPESDAADEELEKLTIERLQLERRAQRLRRTIFNIHLTDKRKNEMVKFSGLIAELKEILKNPIITFKTKVFAHNGITTAYSALNDFDNSLKAHKNYIKVWDDYPNKKPIHKHDYKVALSNYIVYLIQVEKLEELMDVIAELEQLEMDTEREKADLFYTINMNKLIYYLNRGAEDKALSLVPELEKGLKKYKAIFTQKVQLDLYINIAMVYFRTNRFDKAIGIANQIYDINPKLDSHLRHLHTIKFIELMSHFKLKNFSNIEYMIKNAERHFKQVSLLDDFTISAFKILKKMSAIGNSLNQKELKNKAAEHSKELSAAKVGAYSPISQYLMLDWLLTL